MSEMVEAMSMSSATRMDDLLNVTRSGFDLLIKSTMEGFTTLNKPEEKGASSPEKKGSAGFGAIGKSISAALGPMAMLGAVMEGFLEPVDLIIDPLTTIGEIFSVLLYPILTLDADALYFIMPYLEAFVGWLTPFLNFLFSADGIMAILTVTGTFLLGIFTSIGNWFTNLGTTISDGFNTVIGWFGNLGTTIWTAIVNGFWVVINWFAALPQLILDSIIGGATALGTGISNWWNDLWS